MLTRRDHSEKEIREKLKQRFDAQTISEVIEKLDSYGFLKEPEELARLWARALGAKGRGHRRISQELKKRGLPPIEFDDEDESARCREVFMKRFKSPSFLEMEDRAKAYRYLTYRGFNPDTIKRILNELKTS